MFHTLILKNFWDQKSQNKEIKSDETTYYFIRHAEKNRSNPKDNNPELNKEEIIYLCDKLNSL